MKTIKMKLSDLQLIGGYYNFARGCKIINGKKQRFTAFWLCEKLEINTKIELMTKHRNVEFMYVTTQFAPEQTNNMIYIFDNNIRAAKCSLNN